MNSIKLTEQTTLSAKDLEFEIAFNKYEKKALQGFLSITLKEKGTVSAFFNDLQVIRAKDGSLFIKEPVKYGKKEDGTLDFEKEFSTYLLPKAYKDLAVKMLENQTKYKDAI